MLSLAAQFIAASNMAVAGAMYTCPGDARCPAEVFALTYKLCATDDYSDGKERTTCDWDKNPLPWVYVGKSFCDSEGKKELSVNYGDWRTLGHKRLQALEYRCTPLMVLTPKDVIR